MKADKLRIKGKANELIGRGRVMTANVAGSREGQLRGRAQQWKGRAQVGVSDARNVASGRMHDVRARLRARNGGAAANSQKQPTEQKQNDQANGNQEKR